MTDRQECKRLTLSGVRQCWRRETPRQECWDQLEAWFFRYSARWPNPHKATRHSVLSREFGMSSWIVFVVTKRNLTRYSAEDSSWSAIGIVPRQSLLEGNARRLEEKCQKVVWQASQMGD